MPHRIRTLELRLSTLAWRRTQPCAIVNTALVNGIFARAPYGGTNRVGGAPKCVAGHAQRARRR
eukprot:5952980-Pyramimonas_sp.AAC.1